MLRRSWGIAYYRCGLTFLFTDEKIFSVPGTFFSSFENESTGSRELSCSLLAPSSSEARVAISFEFSKETAVRLNYLTQIVSKFRFQVCLSPSAQSQLGHHCPLPLDAAHRDSADSC